MDSSPTIPAQPVSIRKHNLNKRTKECGAMFIVLYAILIKKQKEGGLCLASLGGFIIHSKIKPISKQREINILGPHNVRYITITVSFFL